MKIYNYTDLPTDFDKQHAQMAVKEIFFSTSEKKDFASEKEKNDFFERWCGQYLFYHSSWAYLSSHNNEWAGYLVGSPHSDHLSCSIFSDLFESFPAHCHINCSSKYRSQGVGRMLMASFENKLKKHKKPGLHIVTTPDSKNVFFYRKIGFDFEKIRSYKSVKLLFMGKRLFN